MFKKDTQRRNRKRIRVRKKLSGDTMRPRLSVFRSLNHIYAQLIDDTTGKTIADASSKSKELLEDIKSSKGKIVKSTLVGKLIAKRAIEKGVTTAVFDRSGYNYHGRVKAVAEGAREGGLKI
jgi:large subunit ribosomal protein L18